MDRDLLKKMLDSQKGIEEAKGTFKPGGSVLLALLLRSNHGAPTPLPKVGELTLGDDWATARAGEDVYLLPYDALCGIKITERDAKTAGGSRAGFI
jgi:hypothetical protein